MCLTPINLKKETLKQKMADTYHMQQVPCGRCIECRKLRVNSWYVRLMNELEHCSSAYFVTLTYDDSCINYSDNGLMTLHYRDTQLFWKRLRKMEKNKDIKYFLVGEYGEKFYRPHYHAIVFNVKDVDSISVSWPHGLVHCGSVTDASIFYTLKYCIKSLVVGERDKDDDRVKEKALMSKGLGSRFLTPQMIKYFKDDVSRGVTMLGNKKTSLPRYYRDKIFNESDKRLRNKLLEDFMDERLEKVSSPLFPQRVEKMYNDYYKKLVLESKI